MSPPVDPALSGKHFLHLVPDEKFIDAARDIFEEVLPEMHDYLYLSSAKLQYIRKFQPNRLQITDTLYRGFLGCLPKYKAVFIHFLDNPARLVVDRAPPDTRFIWLGWGADYYHLICKRDGLLLPETRALMARLRRAPLMDRAQVTYRGALQLTAKIVRHPVWSVHRFHSLRRLRRIRPSGPDELSLLNRIALFAPVLREDYDAVKDANPAFSPDFAEWNYWTPGFGTTPSAQYSSGRNLLLGNSATPENNHLDTLRLLAGLVSPERKIICPLSYGTSEYGNAVAAMGKKEFGHQFVPLRKFVDATSYTEILKSCSIVAMNHLRQQALGNIIMMLWLGARVFVNHASPINAMMSRLGIDVYDIRSLPGFLMGKEPELNLDQVVDTRKRLVHRFGREAILSYTRALLIKAVKPRQ